MSDQHQLASSLEQRSIVTNRREIAPKLVVLRFLNPTVAHNTIAGQFVNVLPKRGALDPLLRRPFSVYNTNGDEAEIIVQAVGTGTNILATTQEGDELDVLGPLGNPWKFDSNDFRMPILVVGGAGVASMPLLTRELIARSFDPFTYYGARTASLIADDGLSNLRIATDDGSAGFRGTNIALLESHLADQRFAAPKLFVCGPTPMMRAAAELAKRFSIPCEVSLETEMACGIGICQGCPVLTDEATFESIGKRFRLVCTEGPSFSSKAIAIR